MTRAQLSQAIPGATLEDSLVTLGDISVHAGLVAEWLAAGGVGELGFIALAPTPRRSSPPKPTQARDLAPVAIVWTKVQK